MKLLGQLRTTGALLNGYKKTAIRPNTKIPRAYKFNFFLFSLSSAFLLDSPARLCDDILSSGILKVGALLLVRPPLIKLEALLKDSDELIESPLFLLWLILCEVFEIGPILTRLLLSERSTLPRKMSEID